MTGTLKELKQQLKTIMHTSTGTKKETAQKRLAFFEKLDTMDKWELYNLIDSLCHILMTVYNNDPSYKNIGYELTKDILENLGLDTAEIIVTANRYRGTNG